MTPEELALRIDRGERWQTTATATYRPQCRHLNGWYVTARFWIFTQSLFVCSDCGLSTKAKDAPRVR